MVSFIVPAHNEELLLPSGLRAMRDAGERLGEAYEIILVNDGSTDGTVEVAREAGARVLTVNHRQIAATRNAGAREARGDWFVFVDADTVVNVEAVAAALRAMREGAVGGGAMFRFDGPVPAYGRAILAFFLPIYRGLGLASGCFLFCRRKDFWAVGGFDESLFAAEEAALSWRLSRRGKFVVLPQRVITSGRKLRTYSAREVVGLFARVGMGLGKGLRSREGLEVWYGPRREERMGER